MGNDSRRRLALAAAFLVVATAGSRILGLIRESVMSGYLGLGDDTMGAFTVANKIPSLVRTLLADTALSAALIPVFSDLLQRKRRREAWQVAFTVMTVATGVLGIVTLLGMIFAPQVIKVLARGPDYNTPEMIALMAHLMRVMFPTVVILGMAGVFMGILNSFDHFTMPALAPIIWNLIIIGVVVGFSKYGVNALAWGVFAGTVVELVIQVPAVWRRRWRRRVFRDYRSMAGQAIAEAGRRMSPWRIDLKNPNVKRVGVLLGPVIISLGIINFNSFIDTMIATYIHIEGDLGAPAIIERAFRLFQLPQGMFAIAIGTVLFPAFSRHAAAGRMKEFRADLSTGLRQIFFVTLPFAAFFAVLAVPTIRLIYEHGLVTAEGTGQIASALMFFSVGMAFVSVNTLLNRAFYGIQKPWLPLITGVLNLALNLVLDLLLYKPLGVGGITLSTSIVSLVNFFALMMLLGPRIGGVDARRVAWSAFRSIVALVPLAGVSYWVWYGFDLGLGRAWWAQIISLGLAYAMGAVTYCGAAWAMRMPEIREVVDIIRRRREPRATEEVIDTEAGG
jgi:putative peptidoglycan lipid II flippase